MLWTNWVAGVSFSESYYASAVSSSPLGPFKLAVNQINTGFNNTGDFSLFVDDNGDAYVIYTAHITGSGILFIINIINNMYTIINNINNINNSITNR